MTDERDRWTAFHFSQSNPIGAAQTDVAALLRRVADSLDALGPVEVLDITFRSAPTKRGRPTLTVYYDRE